MNECYVEKGLSKFLMVEEGFQEVVDLENVDCTYPRHKENNNTSPSM
jgi:hypothetical protein